MSISNTSTHGKERRINTFNGDDFSTYKKQLMAAVVGDAKISQILKITNDRQNRPGTYKGMMELLDTDCKTADNDDDDQFSLEESTKADAKLAPFFKANRELYSLTFGTVSKDILKYLTGVVCGDGRGAFAALLDEYERPSKASMRSKLQQLFNMQQDKAEPFSDYLHRINSVIQDLESLGFETHDEMSLSIVLNGLRSEFKTIRVVINADDDIDLSQAVQKLRNFDEQLQSTRQDDLERHETDCALLTTYPPPSTISSSCGICLRQHPTQSCKSVCMYCNKTGHRHRDCPTKTDPSASTPRICFRCQKPGHISRNCTAPAPIPSADAINKDKINLATDNDTNPSSDWMF